MKNEVFKKIYICLSLLLLLGYLSTLILLTWRLLEGCFVNFLQLNNNQIDFFRLIMNVHPIVNLAGLALATYLWFRFAKALISTVKRFFSYRSFIQSLVAIDKKNILIIKNKTDLLFTAGIRNPKIWISENLLRLLDRSQYKAVISHEYNHILNKDPLWKTLNEVLKEILPPIPRLKTVIDKFNIVIELAADEYAIQKTNSESLLSALLILMKKANTVDNPLLVGISGNSERLQILTSKKRLNHFAISSYSSILLGFFVVVIVTLLSFNLFNHDCNDPRNCIYLYTLERKMKSGTDSREDLLISHNMNYTPVK